MSAHRRLQGAQLVETVLSSHYKYLLASAIMAALAVTFSRLGPGIPMGVDTTSHLYKIIFLQYWWKQGVDPFWSLDWYAGSPALLLYPPLSYYLTAAIAMLGVDPVLAYKVVDAFFYAIAPVTIFYLARELGFDRGESALGALMFSLFPQVIENYLFFDRFPTTVAIPICCIFLIFFHRALKRPKPAVNVFLSILSMSTLLLVHHLSAVIAGIVAVLMALLTAGAHGILRQLLRLVVVAVGTLGITAFWLLPFLESYGLFSANGFYNRNVTFPFLRFTYFGFDVASYLLGIVQFVLAAVAVQSVMSRTFRSAIRLAPVSFFTCLLSGMASFQAGEILSWNTLQFVGEFIVALSFTVFLVQFVLLRSARRVLAKKDGAVSAALWFIVFLWLGLGFYALPVLQLPVIQEIWIKTMDVYRIWLYLALPMSALAARGFLRCAGKLITWRPVSVILLLVLVITPVTIGVVLKVNYDLNATINGVLPYTTANTEIPAQIINYFRNDSSQGRILGVNVPLWIYLLPMYVDKPIIDGWYPQTKLVIPLVEINDYRLDDLETAATPTVRFNEWRSLINQAQLLDITWVIIGDNGSLATALMGGTGFAEKLTVPYADVQLVVYKSTQPQSLVDGDVNVTGVSTPSPDQMQISVHTTEAVTTILVKEAYFPTWIATADGGPLTVNRDSSTGYIFLILPAGTREVTLYQNANETVWNAISVVSLITALVFAVGMRFRSKKVRA
jgi:hypothetical protein